MLLEQTFEKLTTLQLHGMVEALQRFTEKGATTDVSPTDLVGLLADAESAHRDNRKLQLRLKNAKLRQQACIEDVDYRHQRGLSKDAAARPRDVALGGAAPERDPHGPNRSREELPRLRARTEGVSRRLHRRLPPLLAAPRPTRAGAGRQNVPHRAPPLRQDQVLVLDDFGLDLLGATERKLLLDVLEDRYGVSSTIVTSQVEPDLWHAVIGEETAAELIYDRLAHDAHRVKLPGESIRKTKSSLNGQTKSAK